MGRSAAALARSCGIRAMRAYHLAVDDTGGMMAFRLGCCCLLAALACLAAAEGASARALYSVFNASDVNAGAVTSRSGGYSVRDATAKVVGRVKARSGKVFLRDGTFLGKAVKKTKKLTVFVTGGKVAGKAVKSGGHWVIKELIGGKWRRNGAVYGGPGYAAVAALRVLLW